MEPVDQSVVNARWGRYLQLRGAMGVVLSAALMAACSGGDQATAPTEPPPTTAAVTTTVAPVTTAAPTTTEAPTTTAAPTTTMASTTTEAPVDYAVQYREAIAVGNCERDRVFEFEETVFGSTNLSLEEATSIWEANLEAIQERFVLLAGVLDEGASGLLAMDWPDEIRADIEGLAFELGMEAEGYRRLAQVDDYLTYYNYDFDQELGYVSSNEAATAIRAALGLPSPDDDTTDFCALAAG